MERFDGKNIAIGLSAAVVGLKDQTPLILTICAEDKGDGQDMLPFGPFDPLRHRTFELGLRAFVEAQAGLQIGHVEQLYTFGDRGRHAQPGDKAYHVVSVGYLALSRGAAPEDAVSAEALKLSGASFQPWYVYFPWEDWRAGRPEILDQYLLPALSGWASHGDATKAERLKLAFALDGLVWDDERVLDRYELLYEAGLVREVAVDGRDTRLVSEMFAHTGRPMRYDHRRILATAISRLRAKLKYRPLVFELMGDEFTLTDLQKTVEALAGRHLHKQNFRRLVEANALVEPTGTSSVQTGGRPAQLFRFRREVLLERPAPGLRV
ncbi:NAD regulator [Pararhizobium sp. IMCC21322]|uniref:NUDIX hydrolase n=1 Tax=Pararhizobium sp. IMCC21322 TaxID=3067903 RepID=UPI0027412392|nr:NAD regulator [Pararhizobium sp. IMCC21322]